MANLHSTIRWQELVPLFSQQCRLRHLVRITAFNLDSIEEGKLRDIKQNNPQSSPSHSAAVIDSAVSDIFVYYYTLHLTTMSAPFYKSEKVHGENPRWAELDIQEIMHKSSSLVSKGVVVRIWKQNAQFSTSDEILVTAWGVYFSGLVPVPMTNSTFSLPSSLHLGPNTIIFHMRGGVCFTSPHCLSNLTEEKDDGDKVLEKGSSADNIPASPKAEARNDGRSFGPMLKKSKFGLAESEVRSSYTLPLLLRLRTVEHAIRKQAASAGALRERISAASVFPSSQEKSEKHTPEQSESKESTSLKPVLTMSPPNKQVRSSSSVMAPSRIARRHALAQALVATESLRLCVSLLKGERGRKLTEVRVLSIKGQELAAQNKERGKELKEQQESLAKEIEHLKEWRHREFLEARDAFLHTSAHLAFRRRQLVSELSLIYPILQHPNGGYTICGVKLPNSEDFGARDEVMVSVALGYVAHAVQMVSIFLHVPLRYPVVHLGSRSRISDLVADKIPDGEREFPLFSRAKDKLQFKYGVYLLNKNVAQLRWYCGLPTQDLRATLPNLASLFYPKTGLGSIVNSGSISNLVSSNTNGPTVNVDRSPLGPPQGHRRTHSGSSPNLQTRERMSSAHESTGSGPESQISTRPFERGHRVTRSAGGKGELLLPTSSPDVQKENKSQLDAEGKDEADIGLGSVKGSSLSYSLDKGLDEYEIINRVSHHKVTGGREAMSSNGVEGQLTRVNSTLAVDSNNKSVVLGHVGSDPLLGDIMARGTVRLEGGESKDARPSTEARRRFLHGWHLSGGGAPAQSDEDAESSMASEETVQTLNSSSQLLCPVPSVKDGSQRTKDNVAISGRLSSLLPAGKSPPIPSLMTSTTAEVDRLFASVASRTEALASRSTSFNLVRSRQGSTTEEAGAS